MVGAVGEMATMTRCKLWKTVEDGLCCSSSAIQTRLDPSSLLEERSETPLFLSFLLCCRLPPKLGETAKVYRQIDFTKGFVTLNGWNAIYQNYALDRESLSDTEEERMRSRRLQMKI